MLWNPCNPDDEVRNFLFTMYAADTQRIEDVINALSRECYPDDPNVQAIICKRYGLDLDYLTDEELSYIESEVAKRWHGK